MRAFITGASGFIGSHLVEHLLNKEWVVRLLSHKHKIPGEEECEIVRGDINDFQTLSKALKGTDILFHLAAALGSSLIKKKEFFKINALGTKSVLKAAHEAGVKRVIHFSSAGVLGSVKDNQVATENFHLNPQDVYDKSKLEGEKEALLSAQEGMDVVIIRPGWVYGPGDRRTFRLIKAIAKKRFILVTKGNALQTPIFIQDLINGVLLCVEKGKKGEIYHLAGSEILKVKDIVKSIASATGTKIPPFSLPLFPVKLTAYFIGKIYSLLNKEAPLNLSKLAFFIHPKPLSIQKAKKELKFSPKTNFKEGLIKTVSWYRDQGWL